MRLTSFCSLTFALVASFITQSAVGQTAKVTLGLTDKASEVQAHYVLDSPVRTLRFATGGEVRLRTWHASNGAVLASDGNSLEFARPTAQFTIALAALARDGELDRVYSPVIMFGDGHAAAVYSDYLLPKAGGRIVFERAGVARGKPIAPNVTAWSANDAASYLLVGSSSVRSTQSIQGSFDTLLPDWVRDRLIDISERVSAKYAEAFGTRPTSRPWVIATFTHPTSEGSTFRGDTNPGMIRLNIVGRDWLVRSRPLQDELDVFIAHELFHQWNAQLRHQKNGESPWLLEGGADAAAYDALRQLGLVDQSGYRDRVSTSLVRCDSASGSTLKDKLDAGGRTYYDCGSALFYLASRLNSDESTSLSPIAVWRALFNAEAVNADTYSIADFVHVLHQLRAPHAVDDQAPGEKLLTDLIASNVSWRVGLERGTSEFHLRPVGPEDVANSAFASSILDSIVIGAVANDCHGSTSVGYENLVYQIDSLPSCDRLKSSMVVTRLNGSTMSNDPPKAAAEALKACANHQELQLGESEGRSLGLNCATSALQLNQPWIPTTDASNATAR